MPSWTYKKRPEANKPDKIDVEVLVSDLRKRLQIQDPKTLGKKKGKKSQIEEKESGQRLVNDVKHLSLKDVDFSNSVSSFTAANVGAPNASSNDICREQKLAQIEQIREYNALKKRDTNSDKLPKFNLAQDTAQVFETLTRCAIALNSEQHEMFESKRDAQKKLATAVNELNVFKKHNVEIPSEVLMELYGIESWAQYYIDNDRQGPKVDYWVRGAFECLYYDWMILTGAEPVFRAARGDNKKTVGQAGIFISQAWALMFPEPRHVLPARTMRDWADDLKAGGISGDPKHGRLKALAYLPKE